VIVAQSQITQVHAAGKRQVVLSLPVRHGRFGELKRCPVRKGAIYNLQPPVPYDRRRAQAEEQPTRARAVLWLIDRCQATVKSTPITVIENPERQGDQWLVRCVKGEHLEMFDRDVFLSRHNDFTMDASRQTVKGDPPYTPPFAEDLERARAKALEGRVDPQRQAVKRITGDVETLAESLESMKARNRLRRIKHDLVKLALELPPSTVLDSGLPLARDETHADAHSPHSQGALRTPEAA
jgi:hypothetical protein